MEMAEGLVGAAAIAVGIYLVGFWAPRRVRRARAEEQRQSEVVRQRRMKESAESVKVELHDMVREMIATLDTKIVFLKELVDRSDESTRRLEALITESASLKSAIVEEPVEEPVAEEPKFQEVHSEVIKLHEAGKTIEEIAETTGHPAGEVQLILGLNSRRDERESA